MWADSMEIALVTQPHVASGRAMKRIWQVGRRCVNRLMVSVLWRGEICDHVPVVEVIQVVHLSIGIVTLRCQFALAQDVWTGLESTKSTCG